ncbi:MAG: glycosyltransferase [Acidimicrobiia bacterium]
MRIGMVGVRFAGLDGVTLESAKLASVLREAGHEVVWFAGELGPEFSPGDVVPEAHFLGAANRELYELCFGSATRSDETSALLRERTRSLKDALGAFVEAHAVDAIMPQNALAIPLQLPLGLAITELVTERGLQAVAHGHDFAWERERFEMNAVGDVLATAFPPPGPEFEHLVINSQQQQELARRIGRPATVLPNVMDFETGPGPTDPARFREAAGLSSADLLLIQPTRIVPRKNIEASIDLAARLRDESVVLVVTHPEQDEGGWYWPDLTRRAEDAGVDLRLVPVEVPGGPTLADAYAAADLILYPTLIEGFGNALVETMFYRRPLLINRYPVYTADIRPSGVNAIEIEDGKVTDDTVEQVARWLANPEDTAALVEDNYAIGLRHYSFQVVRERVLPLFDT